MIGFLEQDIRSDSRLFKPLIVFHRCRRNIHIDAPDRPIIKMNGINGLDALEHILKRTIFRVFPRFQCKAFVPHLFKRLNLLDNFLLRKLFTLHARGMMISAIAAFINTVIRKIERREHHDAVPINVLFNLFCRRKHLFNQFLILHIAQDAGLFMRQAAKSACFMDNAFYLFPVFRLFLCHCE
ncbi:MAG: hypothetical protein DELT_03044 [Desulfovibrio sp.]